MPPIRIRRCITITPQVRYRDLSAIVTNGRTIIEALVPPSRYIRSSTSHGSIGSILKENHLGGSSPSDPFTLSSCRTVLGLVVVHQQITCLPDLSNPKSRPGDRASGVPLILICFLLRDSVKASTSNTTRSPLLQERPNQCNSEEDPHGPFVLFSARLSRFHGLRLCDLPSQLSFISHISRPLHLTNQKVSG